MNQKDIREFTKNENKSDNFSNSSNNNPVKTAVVANPANCAFEFNLNVGQIKRRQEKEFSVIDEIKMRRLVNAAKQFYERNERNYKYGINRATYKMWKETAYVGRSFKDFISSAPLIVVMTQFINERKAMKDLTVDDDYICGLLNFSEDMDDFNDENDENKTPNFIDEKKYKKFCHECHFKRFKFIRYYFKEIFNFLEFEEIKKLCEDLREYSDIIPIYKKIIDDTKKSSVIEV